MTTQAKTPHIDIAKLLQSVQTPGDFFAEGRQTLSLPKLMVDTVGLIALPLLPQQAGQLIAAAERAPYGRGQDTLVDTTVRRTWQIASEQVQLGGRGWDQSLREIVSQVGTKLGVRTDIVPEFYKLLVYDEGSFL